MGRAGVMDGWTVLWMDEEIRFCGGAAIVIDLTKGFVVPLWRQWIWNEG